MNKYLLHHFGLGDFLSCKGLVKYLIQNNQNPKTIFYLFVPSRHFKNISFLYRTEKIELIKVDDEGDAKKYFVKQNFMESSELITIGFQNFSTNFQFGETPQLSNQSALSLFLKVSYSKAELHQ